MAPIVFVCNSREGISAYILPLLIFLHSSSVLPTNFPLIYFFRNMYIVLSRIK